MGDRLIVGLSTDKFNRDKGKESYFTFSQRKELLSTLDCVDLIIPENNWWQKKRDIMNNQVDIFVIGDDWKGKFDSLRDYCSVIYLPRTENISSSDIKEEINSANTRIKKDRMD